MMLRTLAICAVAAGALAAAPAAEAAPVVLAPAQIEPQAPLTVKALGLAKGARYVVRVRAGNPTYAQSCTAVVAGTTRTTFRGAMLITLAPPKGRLWCNGKTYSGVVQRASTGKTVLRFRTKVRSRPAAHGTLSGWAMVRKNCTVAASPCLLTPAQGAVMVVMDAAGNGVIARTSTDRSGRFAFTLRPGNYRLVPQKLGLHEPPEPMNFTIPASGPGVTLTVHYGLRGGPDDPPTP